MDVATLVKNITSAFEDASSLVKRIRTKKESEPDADTQPIDDLIDSLSLGPTVVRGYYESDAKRFGGIYTTGDSIAREQLKDALINLQSTVISSLQSVIIYDKDPDYDGIQSAADDCRVNVGVCLGQLSQRMSKAVRAQNSAGKAPAYDNGQNRTVQRSYSHSTQSSGYVRDTPLTPPESDTEFLGDSATNLVQQLQQLTARAPDHDVMSGMHAASYAGLYSPPQEHIAPLAFRRASSVSGVGGLEPPVSPQDQNAQPFQRYRDSTVSTSTTSSRGNVGSPQLQPVQEGLGSKEPGTNTNPWGYFPPINTSVPNQYSDLTSATLGKTPSANLLPVQRKPLSPIPASTVVHSLASMRSYDRPSIPEEVEKEVYFPPPIPNRSMSRAGSYPRTASVVSDTTYVRASVSGPLNLPTDKNLLGFCKGAFRLQAGMEKKAFIVASRPLGMASMIQYWKCDKCYFEGPCTTLIPPGGKKPEKHFDSQIRDYNGIRYKWAFLAKCHVPLKSMAEGRRDGSYGSFGCIFCTAEATQRGWPAVSNTMNPEKASIKSSNSGQSSAGTAVFGNIHGLMDHLQMHRQPEFWPGVEMQGRLKCIVGRTAQRGEEFDINFLPIS